MSGSVIYWKYGDTKRAMEVQLVAADGTYPTLTSVSSVTFKFKASGGSTISKTGAVSDSSTGKVSWTPEADQSDYGSDAGKIAAGTYDLQVFVLWSDNREQTFPTQGNAKVIVEAAL